MRHMIGSSQTGFHRMELGLSETSNRRFCRCVGVRTGATTRHRTRLRASIGGSRRPSKVDARKAVRAPSASRYFPVDSFTLTVAAAVVGGVRLAPALLRTRRIPDAVAVGDLGDAQIGGVRHRPVRQLPAALIAVCRDEHLGFAVARTRPQLTLVPAAALTQADALGRRGYARRVPGQHVLAELPHQPAPVPASGLPALPSPPAGPVGAVERGGAAAGERRGQQRGVRLVLGVRLRVAAALHALRGDGQRQPRVAGDLARDGRRTSPRSTQGPDLLARCPSPARGAAGRVRASRGHRGRCCAAPTPAWPWRALSSPPAPAGRAGRRRPRSSRRWRPARASSRSPSTPRRPFSTVHRAPGPRAAR